jgi:hypothetical protein
MKAPAGNQRHLMRSTASLGAAGLAFTLVASILACGGDDGPSADVATPSPEPEGGTIEVPADFTRPPEITPAPPTQIEIRGQQVPLAPGMTYAEGSPICESCPPGPFTEVRYDSNPAEVGVSRLVFDQKHNLMGSHIRPEDQDEFQPFLDILLAYIIIRGQPVPLAQGMSYGKLFEVCDPPPCRQRDFWNVQYDSNPAEVGASQFVFDDSYFVFDDSYKVIRSEIRPEDQGAFQPILDALAGT